jgi:hypothetical protein
MSEQAAAKVTGAHLARTAYLYVYANRHCGRC